MNFWQITLELLGGFGLTCLLFFLTLLFAIPLGLGLSFCSMSKLGCVKKATRIFIWIIRGIPLMLLEKCVIREIADCKACDARGAVLTDRRGAKFPVLRLPPHRNIIYNSLPTYTADMQDKLAKHRVGGWHFIFSIETPSEVDEIVRAYQKGDSAPRTPVRRIGRT